ncbi:MAG: PQQ-binding-like beta-propeller repeat protein, partial [Planctomycetes bacterium]|nr:PQQ-binding-like beta-propeller repeat protein [Planctomycetota bacterium]
KLRWSVNVSSKNLQTAPVVAGGLVFIADRSGVVRALDENGKQIWKQYTGGAIYYPPAVADDRVFVGSADGRVYAFAARSGRFLWSYRVAPRERLIPVYGRLISTWPVAGGVVVKNGTVYAAAGIAHYDGTHVVALDAKNGKVKAKNNSSGVLSKAVNSGISLQGNLMIVGNELRFLAGGVYETARYDLKTLKCLNKARSAITSQFRTAFYPYYPSYGKYVSLDYSCSDGSTLCHDASYEGSKFNNLSLQAPLPPGAKKERKQASRWLRRRGKKAPKNLWRDNTNRRFTSFIVSGKTLLATGHPDQAPKKSFLIATNIKDGKDIWRQSLPSNAVKGGTAIGRDGRIYVALENGRLLCFEPVGK